MTTVKTKIGAGAGHPSQTKRTRGRPRDPQVRDAILRAALEIIDSQGPAALTMEGVALKAGVGKPTVYRWWPNRHAVAMDAMMQAHAHEAAPPTRRGRAALKALQQQLESATDVFTSRTGRNMASMIAGADNDSELSKTFRNHFVLARREEGRALLLEAIDNGDVRSDINVDIALDLIYGALFFRLLLGHATIDRSVVAMIVSHALRGVEKP
jgi:AcrR family transcriptional regulator